MTLPKRNFKQLSEAQRIYFPVAIVLLFLNLTIIIHSLHFPHNETVTIIAVTTAILFIFSSVFGVHFSLPLMKRRPILYWINVIVNAVLIGIITANDPDHLLNISLILIAVLIIGTTLIAGRYHAYLLVILTTLSRNYVYFSAESFSSLDIWMRIFALPIAGIVGIETIMIMRKNVEQEVRRLSAINTVAQSISSSLEISQVITLISKAIQNSLKADTYYVALLEGDILHMEMLYDDGVFFPSQDVSTKGTLAGHVINSHEPLLLFDLSKDIKQLGIHYAVIGKPKISRSWMGAPLIVNQQPIGLVAVAAYKPGIFTSQDLTMLESIALQASLAIDNARHHTEVEYQSKIDSLTGALNHGCFIKALEEEVRTATKLDKSLALIMMDIDHFKIYNDTWGHLVGDQVLTELTNVIKQHIKKTDLVGRWGGEEFIIALPNANCLQATAVAKRIRNSMREITITTRDGHRVTCPTVSQGIAILLETDSDAFALIDQADKCLYKAKDRGRNEIEPAGVNF